MDRRRRSPSPTGIADVADDRLVAHSQRTSIPCCVESPKIRTRDVGHFCPPSPVLCPPTSRKEVIQPQVPLRLPCYDFTPVADLTVVGCLLTVGAPPSGKANSHGVTGGVYKARERIHRGMLIRDY
jgi:hypothetical protein